MPAARSAARNIVFVSFIRFSCGLRPDEEKSRSAAQQGCQRPVIFMSMFCQDGLEEAGASIRKEYSALKIIIAEKISAAAVEQLQEPGWTVITADQLNGKLAGQLESAEALIVRSAVQADAELLSHAKKLRVIGRAGVGVDNIDLDAATRQGIAVMNTPGANAVAVAEHTMGMMLAMARHLCRADTLMHAGKWEKKSLQGT